MFKIDQYVTPLILKYVDKYVKNIRPQDAQVSLWGGDVCFQNLDMKLEVLEDELQLPFNFLSGHIHELSIHIPWTALQSEPIKITINTIEFVIKLRDPNESRRPSLKEAVKKKLSNEEVPGYIASLMNKIANNIQLTCHNIILKYIEEEIVVSMNIQHLSLCSANESWQPAFIDVSPTKLLLRKLVDVNDLTICLDKRNAAGKIEVCQEPILYRCSLQFRFYRRTANVTRIDMLTKCLEMSISSLQLPMLLRLFELGLALKLGKIKSDTALASQSVEQLDGAETSRESYASWIWNNVVPSIFPDDDEEEQERREESSEKVLHFGCYVESFKLDFKIVEFIGEQIVSKTKKIRYQPILKIHLDKAYMDAIMYGERWFNYKGGVMAITAEFLGDCPCGNKKTMEEVFKSRQPAMAELIDYTKDTLMDEQSVENNEKFRNYNTNWNNHFIYVNEEGLMAKTPAMSFDIVHFVDIPADQSVSEVGSDLEYSNFSEKYLMRLFVGGFDLKIGADFLHRLDSLVSFAKTVEYPAYYTEKAPLLFSQLPSCSTEDYEALMAEIPIKEIQLTVSDASVEFHFWDHEKMTAKLRKRLSTVDVAKVPSTVVLHFEHLEFQIVNPVYPNRLIYTTCQLPEPPSNLFDKCFLKTTCNIRKLSLAVRNPVVSSSEFVLFPANVNFKTRYLLLPELWSFQTSLIRNEHLLEVSNSSFSLSALECSTILFLAKSLRDRKTVQLSTPSESTVHIDVEVEKLVLRSVKTFSANLFNATVNCVVGTIGHKTSDKKNLLFMWPHLETTKKRIEGLPFISVSIQLPIVVDDAPMDPSFFELKMVEGIVNLDLLVFEFQKQISQEVAEGDVKGGHRLQHQDSISEINVETPKRIHTSEKGTKKNMPTIPSIHSSSEKDLTLEMDQTVEEVVGPEDKGSEKLSIVSYYLRVKNLILNIEINKIVCLYFENSLTSSSATELLANIADCSKNCVILDLPTISLTSTLTRAPSSGSNTNILANIQPCSSKTDSFPWKLSLQKFAFHSICNQIENSILTPISTNITVAVNVKSEESGAAEMSLNFHIDNTPIQVNLIVEQINFLIGVTNKLIAAIPKKPERSVASFERLELLEKSSQRQLQIDQQTEVREFLAMTTTTTKDEDKPQASQKTPAPAKSELSLWLQWTISKFSVHLHTADHLEKFMTDFEDIIVSLDKQDIYFKLKTKIATLSGQYYQKSAENEAWQKSEAFSVTTTTSCVDDSLAAGAENDIFMDLTLTKAETANVHAKWGTFKHNQSLNPTLTEIIVKLQQIDAAFDVDLLTKMAKLMQLPDMKKQRGQLEVQKVVDEYSVNCVANLPLVHLESKGLRLFLPIEGTSSDCSVYILKINRISLVPSVENPINRAQLRPDIYTKAAQLRLINLAGSKVEDRQYEFGLKRISLSTANWSEVVKYFKSDEKAANHSNPAFEWNNLQTDDTLNNFNILTILKDLNFSIIYAPSIVFRSVVVCGEAVELNCFTDLNLEIDTRQIELVKSVFDKLSRIVKLTPPKPHAFKLKKAKNGRVYVEVNGSIFRQSPDSSTCEKDDDEQGTVKNASLKKSRSLVDSGVESTLDGFGTASYSTRKLMKNRSFHKTSISTISSVHNAGTGDLHIPYEVSIISGISTFKVYQSDQRRRPLFSVELTQPNMLISYGLNEKSVQFSLFDLRVALGSGEEEFEATLFETKAGEPNALGIVQPWLQVKQKMSILTGNEQLNLDVKRPMKLSLSDSKLDRILNLKLLMEDTLNGGTPKPRREGAIASGGGRFMVVRELFGNLTAVNVTCGQVVVEIFDESRYNMKVSVDGFEGDVKISERPEKIQCGLKLKSLLVSDTKAIILHPLTLNTTVSLTNEYWKKEPLIFVYLDARIVEVDMNPQFVRNLSLVRAVFNEVLQKYTVLADQKVTAPRVITQAVTGKHLIPIPMPRLSTCRMTLLEREELYQDDLRAGAFQFIETFCEKEHPLPYQIQIINKELGIVCWRYPQPRSLSRVQVFPVPLNSTKVTSINCYIEYYSDLHKEFRKYCDFYISDTVTQSLQLPERKIASSMWRAVMANVVLNGNDDEEDEDATNDQANDGFRLHPKILIACIRIDSLFSTQLIPNLEWKLNFDKVQVNLSNVHRSDTSKTPDVLKLFEMNDDAPKLYRFLSGSVTSLKMDGCLFDNLDVVFNASLGFGVDILDYGCLTSQSLVDRFMVKSMVMLQQEHVCVNTMTEEVRVNYGPSVGHTLAVSEQLWRDYIEATEDQETVLVTKYIICNNTSIYFHVRQWSNDGVEVADGLNLKPKTYSMYPLPKSNQEQQLLQFSCQESNWEFSAPVVIDDSNASTKFIPFPSGLYLVVSIDSISTTQKLIKLSGQIEFHNMTNLPFCVQYKMQISADEVQARELQLSEKGSGSLLCLSNTAIQQSMRLKLTSDTGKGWSGEIPLKEIIPNSRPWLVKVPSTINKNYCSFWVRIIREDINAGQQQSGRTTDATPQRVLVIIWPLFMLQSHLSCDTTIEEESTGKQYTVAGKGCKRELYLTGTHEDDHKLRFDNSQFDSDKNQVLVSYNLIDKKQFFCIPDKLTNIDRAIKALAKREEIRWPCSEREEELRWERLALTQPQTTPVYSFSKDHDLSCALKLTISSTLFINSTGFPVRLTKAPLRIPHKAEIGVAVTCTIAPNNIVMPFHMDNYFSLEFEVAGTWIGDYAICLNNEKPPSFFTSVSLPIDGSTPICCTTNDGAVKLVLSSINENNIRTLVLSSTFVVSNHLVKFDLKCWAFCVLKSEKKSTPSLSLSAAKEGCIYRMDSNVKETKSVQGAAITLFQDLTCDKRPRKSKSKAEYNFFLAFFDEAKRELSQPLLVNTTRTKNSLNIALDDRYIPISTSNIVYQNQHFISLHLDKSPIMSIENSTDFSIYVGQTQNSQAANHNEASTSKDERTNVSLIPEINDESLVWHQVIPARKTVYYTPPTIDEAFPEMQSTIDFGLAFACFSGNSNIRWSKPVKIDKTKEIFFNVPLYGVLRLGIDMEGETIRLVLDYVSQNMVFSVQDIRSRLSHPTTSSTPDPTDGELELGSSVAAETLTDISSKSVPARGSSADESLWQFKNLRLNLFSEGLKLVLFKDSDRRSCKKEEIVAINLDEIKVRVTGVQRHVHLSMVNIQVDNQLYRSGGAYDFPVILCSGEDQQLETPRPKLPFATSLHDLTKLLETDDSKAIFSVDLRFYETDSHDSLASTCGEPGTEYNVESIHLKVSSIRAYIEDTYINLLLDYLVESLPNQHLVYQSPRPVDRQSCDSGRVLIPEAVVQQARYFSMPVRMKLFRIEPINILLSVHTCMRMYIALDHSPLYFSAYERTNINTLPLKLGNTLGMQYLSRAIFGAGWVIGSLEILGSPSGLARSFSSGLRDFVSMPLQGLFRGPWGFLTGITQGSTSLVRHIAAGTVNSVTKLATSVARNLDRLSLDSEHVERTDALRRNLPLGLSDGLSLGLTGFGISMLSAVGGLAHHSLQATSTVGVVTGMGKGIMGALTKPLSGAAELLALTGQGVLQSVGYNTLPISRLAIMSRENTLAPVPSTAKLVWNYLPELFRAESVLFATVAEMETASGVSRKPVMLGLLSKVFVIVDLSVETTSEILTLDRIQPSVTSSKTNVLTMKVRDSKSNSPSPTRLADQHSTDRVFQYVQQSQFYASLSTSTQQFYETKSMISFTDTEDIVDVTATEQRHIFHLVDATSAQHLLDFLQLAKSTTSIKSNKYSIYEA